MKRYYLPMVILIMLLVMQALPVRAGFFDNLTKGLGVSIPSGDNLDNPTIVKGLKEALSTGTTRAVTSVSQPGGYFNNDMIKILLPENIRKAADLMGAFGFQQQVDDLVLSMNRAAEKAAPKATEHFVAALKEMNFDDARRILNGGPTSATEYFKKKTGDKIFSSFKPVVAASMQDVGVARSYKQVVEKIESLPLVGPATSLDLDKYITSKAVDGLFSMLGEEEKKIRTDPLARSTELLKKVFGR